MHTLFISSSIVWKRNQIDLKGKNDSLVESTVSFDEVQIFHLKFGAFDEMNHFYLWIMHVKTPRLFV